MHNLWYTHFLNSSEVTGLEMELIDQEGEGKVFSGIITNPEQTAREQADRTKQDSRQIIVIMGLLGSSPASVGYEKVCL